MYHEIGLLSSFWLFLVPRCYFSLVFLLCLWFFSASFVHSSSCVHQCWCCSEFHTFSPLTLYILSRWTHLLLCIELLINNSQISILAQISYLRSRHLYSTIGPVSSFSITFSASHLSNVLFILHTSDSDQITAPLKSLPWLPTAFSMKKSGVLSLLQKGIQYLVPPIFLKVTMVTWTSPSLLMLL